MPIPADYDGDGKTNIAVFRPSTGEWFIRFVNDSGSFTKSFLWGNSNMALTPADYDGDGKTDMAFFNPSNGNWWIRFSDAEPDYLRPENNYSGSENYGQYTFGEVNDIPIALDLDGDNKTNIIIFRPSTLEIVFNLSNESFIGLDVINQERVNSCETLQEVIVDLDCNNDSVCDARETVETCPNDCQLLVNPDDFCTKHQERYDQDEIGSELLKWGLGDLNLEEIMLRVKLFKRCNP